MSCEYVKIIGDDNWSLLGIIPQSQKESFSTNTITGVSTPTNKIVTTTTTATSNNKIITPAVDKLNFYDNTHVSINMICSKNIGCNNMNINI